MALTGYAGEEGRLQARVDVNGTGRATVETGIPVLDHLLMLLAEYASFDIALEASGRPLLVSNVDLSDMGVGGLATDLVARFLTQLAEGAGLTLHVRLIEGRDTQHVLEAIFKGLGVALAQSCRPRRRKESDGG